MPIEQTSQRRLINKESEKGEVRKSHFTPVRFFVYPLTLRSSLSSVALSNHVIASCKGPFARNRMVVTCVYLCIVFNKVTAQRPFDLHVKPLAHSSACMCSRRVGMRGTKASCVSRPRHHAPYNTSACYTSYTWFLNKSCSMLWLTVIMANCRIEPVCIPFNNVVRGEWPI